jgi:DNA (cytosine-5)-methyltransferase 1
MDLGLSWAGHGPVVWQVETDPTCLKVLAKHWPDVQRFKDICDIDPSDGSLEYVDIICGGFPCQNLSTANRYADGLDGDRSGLWYRMLEIVSAIRPRWVVVENVAHSARGWVDTIRGELARTGYESIPIPLEARFFGAPHRRGRIIIAAHLVIEWIREQPWRRRRKSGQDPPQLAEPGAHEGWPVGLEVVDEVYGASREMVRALGNVCMPQMTQVVGEVINLVEKESR